MESKLKQEDKDLVKKFDQLTKDVNTCLGKYRFSDAAEVIYHFMWDELGNGYLENVKKRKEMRGGMVVFREVFLVGIKLLHPFMPYVTEAIWQNIPKTEKATLIASKWSDL